MTRKFSTLIVLLAGLFMTFHTKVDALTFPLSRQLQLNIENDDVCPVKYTPMKNFDPKRFPGLPGDHYPIWYIVAVYPPLPEVNRFSCLNINVQYSRFDSSLGESEHQAYNFTQGSIFKEKQFLNFGFFTMSDGYESHWQYKRNSWEPNPASPVTVDVLDTDYINYAVMATCNTTADATSARQRVWVMGRYTDGMEQNTLEYAKLVLRNKGFSSESTKLALVDNTGCPYWKGE